MMRVCRHVLESKNVFNLQDFKQNETKFKQRSTFFSLFDADLFFIWMNTFQHGFHFCHASCPVLPIMLIISRREYSYDRLFIVKRSRATCVVMNWGNRKKISVMLLTKADYFGE